VVAPLVTVAILTLACEEAGASIEFVNRTDSVITILFDGEHTAPSPTIIEPGQSAGVGTLISAWPATITAEDRSGRTLFCRLFTWEELKALDFRVMVYLDSQGNEPSTPSTLAGTNCL
jgi:hypothetical protein